MSVIKFGVLGCAAIARKAFLPALQRSPLAELVAVASRSQEKAAEFARQFNCRGVVGYETLLYDRRIEAVYIALPIGLHAQWTMAAARNNKHILCEKTFAKDLEETEAALAACEQHNVALYEGFAYVFHPQHDYIRTAIERGLVGKPHLFEARFGFPPLDSPIRYSEALGGGALLDAGTYTLHAARRFYGREPIGCHAVLDNGHQEVDIQGSVLLDFGEGQTAQLAFGFANQYQNTYSIWGSEGILTIKQRAFSIPADFSPVITLERQDHFEETVLEPFDQFLGEINGFCNGLNDATQRSVWRQEAFNQAKLIDRVCASNNKRAHNPFR